MYELICLLFDICLLKKGPQDLPCSHYLLRFLATVVVGLNFLILTMQTDWLRALLQSLTGLIMVFVFSGLVLYFAHKLARFYQTTCALVGIDTLISFFALPAIATMDLGQGGLLASLVLLGLQVWNWVITGHIVRNALDTSLSFGLGLAFLYLLVSYQVIAFLFPEAASV